MKDLKVSEITEAVGGRLLCGSPDTVISHISIDSRDVPEKTLFTPIIGERVDAHRFIPQVFEAGGAAVFTSRGEIVNPDKPHIFVEDTEAALERLGAWYRRCFDIPVIGVTGSVGKTSTKEMIAAALAVRYQVLATSGNLNSNIGLPLTLFRLSEKDEIAVLEMGISDFGEMDRLVEDACPDTAVVTNIGVAHIGILGSQDAIMREKLRIARDFKPGQRLFLCCNDPRLAAAAESFEGIAVRYGSKSDGAPEMDYYAEDIHISDGLQSFTFVWPEGRCPIQIRQIGMHNVNNAVAALSIALLYGIEPAEAAKGLLDYRGLPGRQNILHMKDGIKMIDDTYNASPDSIKSGLSVLDLLDNTGRKIAVLGDVLELGEHSCKAHFDTGVWLASSSKTDLVVTVGTEMRALGDGIRSVREDLPVHAFDSTQEASDYLRGELRAQDALLIKGSRGMHLENVVAAVKDFLS